MLDAPDAVMPGIDCTAGEVGGIVTGRREYTFVGSGANLFILNASGPSDLAERTAPPNPVALALSPAVLPVAS